MGAMLDVKTLFWWEWRKKYEPRKKYDILNTHNCETLMVCQTSMDWNCVLSKHVVIDYIANYASKIEKGLKNLHDMLMCISSIKNPNEPLEHAYRTLFWDTIIQKWIGSYETCYLFWNFLFECKYQFVILNIRMKVFKQVQCGTYNANNDNYLLNAYTNRPMNMENLPLIDTKRSWMYDKHRYDDKWLPWNSVAIIRVFPRLRSAPSHKNDKFVEFC